VCRQRGSVPQGGVHTLSDGPGGKLASSGCACALRAAPRCSCCSSALLRTLLGMAWRHTALAASGHTFGSRSGVTVLELSKELAALAAAWTHEQRVGNEFSAPGILGVKEVQQRLHDTTSGRLLAHLLSVACFAHRLRQGSLHVCLQRGQLLARAARVRKEALAKAQRAQKGACARAGCAAGACAQPFDKDRLQLGRRSVARALRCVCVLCLAHLICQALRAAVRVCFHTGPSHRPAKRMKLLPG